MPSHGGLVIPEWRGYLRWLFWVWGIHNQWLMELIKCQYMSSTHHPKLEHIGPMQFKWITEVVVQLHTGIIALNLLCAMCLTSCNADTLKVLAVVWGTVGWLEHSWAVLPPCMALARWMPWYSRNWEYSVVTQVESESTYNIMDIIHSNCLVLRGPIMLDVQILCSWIKNWFSISICHREK